MWFAVPNYSIWFILISFSHRRNDISPLRILTAGGMLIFHSLLILHTLYSRYLGSSLLCTWKTIKTIKNHKNCHSTRENLSYCCTASQVFALQEWYNREVARDDNISFSLAWCACLHVIDYSSSEWYPTTLRKYLIQLELFLKFQCEKPERGNNRIFHNKHYRSKLV